MVPAVADKLTKLGCAIHMQAGAGADSRIPDNAFKNVTFAANPQGLVSDADIVVYDPNGHTSIGLGEGRTHHMAMDYSAWEGFEVDGHVDTAGPGGWATPPMIRRAW